MIPVGAQAPRTMAVDATAGFGLSCYCSFAMATGVVADAAASQKAELDRPARFAASSSWRRPSVTREIKVSSVPCLLPFLSACFLMSLNALHISVSTTYHNMQGIFRGQYPVTL